MFMGYTTLHKLHIMFIIDISLFHLRTCCLFSSNPIYVPLIACNLRNLELRVSHPFAFYALTRRFRVAIVTFVELLSGRENEFGLRFKQIDDSQQTHYQDSVISSAGLQGGGRGCKPRESAGVPSPTKRAKKRLIFG